jgi:2,3-dihydroxy-2,3-dihydrophenylpropionate dehydrogenase
MGVLDEVSVLITGGGSGLGRALVSRFVTEGAHVTVLDRSQDKLEEVDDTFASGVQTVRGDVTCGADNEAAVAAALRRFGRLDVFIGNAGIWDFSKCLLDLDVDQLTVGFDELFAINVKGFILGARAAADPLRRSCGAMIFTLSNASFYPQGGGVLYTASKHAGVGIVRQLAYELAPEVRVNAVATGGMSTDLRGPAAFQMDQMSIPIQTYLREYSALKREVSPDDYASAYVMLASRRDSGAVTGAVFDMSSVGTPARP